MRTLTQPSLHKPQFWQLRLSLLPAQLLPIQHVCVWRLAASDSGSWPVVMCKVQKAASRRAFMCVNAVAQARAERALAKQFQDLTFSKFAPKEG